MKKKVVTCEEVYEIAEEIYFAAKKLRDSLENCDRFDEYPYVVREAKSTASKISDELGYLEDVLSNIDSQLEKIHDEIHWMASKRSIHS